MSYSTKEVKVTAISDTVVILGTPLTDIKTHNGTNHADLGLGALLNFFCWPGQTTKHLSEKERLVIPAFVAYKICGEAIVEREDQIGFFVPC